MVSPWVMNSFLSPRARCRLFCFPPAGRGGSVFAKWANDFPPEIAVCPVQLPGREDRLRDTPYASIQDLLRAMVPALESLFDLPYAFFGHSMGALVSFELARELRRQGRQEPVHLFVSARRAPHLLDPYPPIAHLPDGPFMEAVQRRYRGIPEGIIKDAEMREIILPGLRADFMLIESYSYYSEPPLSCPVTALGGLQDFEIGDEELEAWREHTTSRIRTKLLPGDHFFVVSAADEVIDTIVWDLKPFHGIEAF